MSDLTERRTALMAYAESCLTSGDWHGLRDAAADLEVIEARMEERGTPSRVTVHEVMHDGSAGQSVRLQQGPH